MRLKPFGAGGAASNRYKNPYFRAAHRPRKRPVFILILVVLLVVGATGALLFHPFFNVKAVEASDPRYQERGVALVGQTNIIRLKSSRVADTLAREFNFEDVTVEKNFAARTVGIIIKERAPVLTVESAGIFFPIDRRGVVLATSTIQLPILRILATTTAAERDILMPEARLEPILAVLDVQNAKFVELTDTDANFFTVHAPEGWRALLTFETDVAPQIENLKVTLAKITDRSKLQYIDLRFGDKVYYK